MQLRASKGSPMFYIKYIDLACYPPQACRGSVCSLPHLASVTCSYLEQSVQMKKWPQIRLLLIGIGRLE